MAKGVRLLSKRDRLEATHSSWLSLGELRELVRQADAHGWTDDCLISQSAGGGEHPSLRDLKVTTHLVVEGP